MLPININTAGVQIAMTPPESDKPKRKLLKHLEGHTYLLEIDNSSLEVFTNCDRRAEYQLINGRVLHRSAPLIYGSAIHDALETYYKGERDLEKILAKGFEILADMPPDLKQWRGPTAYREAITKYIERYSHEDTFEVVRTEEPFSVTLGEIYLNTTLKYTYEEIVADHEVVCETLNRDPQGAVFIDRIIINWTGKMDLLVLDQPDLWNVDHKTTSVEGDQYWRSFLLSQQFLGYTWACRKLGHPVRGTMANVIYGRERTKTGRYLDFLRQKYTYSDAQTDEWEKNIMAVVSDFCHRLVSGFFPMKTTHCVAKFGLCPYHDVCVLPAHLRSTALAASTYTDNVWSPLDD